MCNSTITAIFAHARTFIIIANSSVDNLRLSWLLCSGIQVENQLFTPILRVEKKKKTLKRSIQEEWCGNNIFFEAPLLTIQNQDKFHSKSLVWSMRDGRKLFPMKKKEKRVVIQGRYYDVKKNCFSTSSRKTLAKYFFFKLHFTGILK